MATNKIVARFKDGTIIKGKTNNFSIHKAFFHLEQSSGKKVKVEIEKLKIAEINIDDLKAAFFVKDFEGNKEHEDDDTDIVAGGGNKVEVQLVDGEIITGFALSYDPERHGFFVVPADAKSNNERIFIIKSATSKITFL